MSSSSPVGKPSRRRFLRWSLGSAVVAAGAMTMVRTTGYPELRGWKGKVLSSRQAYIIMSASGVMIPKADTTEQQQQIAANVDRYLYTLPKEMMSQVDLVFEVIENLTFINLQYKRFTRLEFREKDEYLQELNKFGGDLRLVYRTLRDFCMLGYYQQETSWAMLNYPGPTVGKGKRERQLKYSSLMAPAGRMPGARVN